MTAAVWSIVLLLLVAGLLITSQLALIAKQLTELATYTRQATEISKFNAHVSAQMSEHVKSNPPQRLPNPMPVVIIADQSGLTRN